MDYLYAQVKKLHFRKGREHCGDYRPISSNLAYDISSGNATEYRHKDKVEPQNITVIDELRADYKRRQANIVLRAVKSIKPAIYESKFLHKVNDNGLKRRLAISHYKVGKLIGGFLSSFGEESEYLSRDCTSRLQEIENEMEQERRQREERENKASRYQYGKE